MKDETVRNVLFDLAVIYKDLESIDNKLHCNLPVDAHEKNNKAMEKVKKLRDKIFKGMANNYTFKFDRKTICHIRTTATPEQVKKIFAASSSAKSYKGYYERTPGTYEVVRNWDSDDYKYWLHYRKEHPHFEILDCKPFTSTVINLEGPKW